MLSQVLPGGSFRSMIGMVGLSEGSPAMKMLDAWVGKMSKCESPLLSKSNDVCLTSDYNKKACDPTSLPVKDDEPKKDDDLMKQKLIIKKPRLVIVVIINGENHHYLFVA